MKTRIINIVMCLFATALIMISCIKEKTATEPTSYNQSIEKARQHQQFLKAAKLKKDGKLVFLSLMGSLIQNNDLILKDILKKYC